MRKISLFTTFTVTYCSSEHKKVQGGLISTSLLEGGWDACTWGSITQQRELFRVHIDHDSVNFRGPCFFVASRGWWGWLSGLSELKKGLVFNIYYKNPHKYITNKHIPPVHASSLFLSLSPSVTSVLFLSHLIHYIALCMDLYKI